MATKRKRNPRVRKPGLPPLFTKTEVRELRKLKRQGFTYAQLAQEFDVCQMTIERAVRGEGAYASIN